MFENPKQKHKILRFEKQGTVFDIFKYASNVILSRKRKSYLNNGWVLPVDFGHDTRGLKRALLSR